MAAEIEVLRTVVGVSVLVFAARVLGTLFVKIKLPEVVGEILAGVVLGPLALGGIVQVFGRPLIELNDLMLAFAEMGAIIILFAAGLEFTFSDFRKAGGPSFSVGAVGVVVPFFLGYQVSLTIGFQWGTAMLIGAALSATSIAVTVRVLEDLGQYHTKEGKIMVNAAMIDDVLGLAVLAVVTSATIGGQIPSFARIAYVTIGSLAIWILILVIAAMIFPRVVNVATLWKSEGTVEALSVGLCFGTSAAAFGLGLSPVVGAFAAGMGLAESKAILMIKDFISKLKLVFGPLFFAVLGAYLNIRGLWDINILLVLAIGAVAIVSKVIGCGIPALVFLKNRRSALQIGVGMVSRGEVGFIILGIGLTSQILNQSTYSAMLIVILLTTIISPLLLKKTYATPQA
jgi:Kef-type K+ transport system membrane component KefB